MQQDAPIRLNKYISESGLCSRRRADQYLADGHVYINNNRASIGDMVRPGDRVRVSGQEIEPRQRENDIFIALNKPVGVTSTTEEGVRNNIVDYVNYGKRIFPIGRLDKDSQGLIFLTNNGDLVNKILRAGNNHEKEYVVTVDKPLTDEVIKGMEGGVPMLGVNTRKCKITLESSNRFRIILVQGLNRQIRRMCSHYNYEVIKLERVRIMNIELKGLPLGDWRELNESEMETIHKMIEDSTSEHLKKSKGNQTAKKSGTTKNVQGPSKIEHQKSGKTNSDMAKKKTAKSQKSSFGSGKPSKNKSFNPKSARSNSKNYSR